MTTDQKVNKLSIEQEATATAADHLILDEEGLFRES